MELTIPILISLGGVVASVASSLAVEKVRAETLGKKIDAHIQESAQNRMETDKNILDLRNEWHDMRTDNATRIALLEQDYKFHEQELQSIKTDIKSIMNNVQEIKEAVIKAEKGEL